MNLKLIDEQFMRQAIRLSREGIGYTEPNPLVGAVVVSASKLVSRGFHSRYGGLHAEREALAPADIPPGCTLYVTLEPCTHFGKTPPCLDIILEKRVGRVVVASIDPNPLISGRGVDALRHAGVTVDLGCLQKEAEWVNRHYLTYIRRQRPHLVIKAGMSADGKMSDARHNARWVTSKEMRDLANELRGEYSAVLVGSGTILADDPSLTIRSSEWHGKRLWRIVLDSRARLEGSRFLQTASKQYPILWVVSGAVGPFSALSSPDLRRLSLGQGADGRIDLTALMTALYELGIASVLIEGGSAIIDSFLMAGLADEMILFTAPLLLGGKDSLTVFPTGRPIETPLRLADCSVHELDSGWIVRGRL